MSKNIRTSIIVSEFIITELHVCVHIYKYIMVTHTGIRWYAKDGICLGDKKSRTLATIQQL